MKKLEIAFIFGLILLMTYVFWSNVTNIGALLSAASIIVLSIALVHYYHVDRREKQEKDSREQRYNQQRNEELAEISSIMSPVPSAQERQQNKRPTPV